MCLYLDADAMFSPSLTGNKFKETYKVTAKSYVSPDAGFDTSAL